VPSGLQRKSPAQRGALATHSLLARRFVGVTAIDIDVGRAHIAASHWAVPFKFLQALALLGWTIGRNVRIDTRWATTNAAEIRRHAASAAGGQTGNTATTLAKPRRNGRACGWQNLCSAICDVGSLVGNKTLSRHRRITESNPNQTIGSIHATCLSALVTDRAMEACYHPSIAELELKSGHSSLVQLSHARFEEAGLRAIMRAPIAAAIFLIFCVSVQAQTLTECGKSDGYAYYFVGGVVPADKGGWQRDGIPGGRIILNYIKW